MDTLDYKIPKFQIMVDILVHHGTVPQTEEYLLFLNEFSRYRKGKETIFEFLNKKKNFIPMTRCSSEEFIAMNSDDIIYVRKKETFESQPQRIVTLTSHTLSARIQLGIKVPMLKFALGLKTREPRISPVLK